MLTIRHIYKHFPNWTSKDSFYNNTYCNIIFLEDCTIATNTHQLVLTTNVSNTVPHLEDTLGIVTDITLEAREHIFIPGSDRFKKLFNLQSVFYRDNIPSIYFASILKTLKAVKSFTTKRMEHLGVLYSQENSRLNYFVSNAQISTTAHLMSKRCPTINCKNWATIVSYDFLVNAFDLLQDIKAKSVDLIIGYENDEAHLPYLKLETEEVQMITTNAQGMMYKMLEEYFTDTVGMELTRG